MFDTLQCRLTSDDAGGIDFLESVPPVLTEPSRHEFSNGDVWISGNLGNLRISLNRFTLKIRGGSICKWWLGDNLQTLSRGDYQRAVDALSDALGVPMDRAEVTRLDVGENLAVKHNPASYYSSLGNLQRYQRLLEPSGLYYTQTQKGLVLYDKVKEAKRSGDELPELYKTANILRVEHRYLSHTPKHLKRERVTMATLADKEVFSNLVNEWYTIYQNISKINV